MEFTPVHKQYVSNKHPSAHLMVDIETTGLPDKGKFNVNILTIAVVPMGVLYGRVKSLYLKIKPVTDNRFFSDSSTLAWWNEQEPEVKAEALSGTLTHEEAAQRFVDYWKYCIQALAKYNTEIGKNSQVSPDITIWGNGNDFDCSIIEAWLTILGHKRPWKFKDSHSMRTALLMCPQHVRSYPPANAKHNALVDAVYQAKTIHELLTGEEYDTEQALNSENVA